MISDDPEDAAKQRQAYAEAVLSRRPAEIDYRMIDAMIGAILDTNNALASTISMLNKPHDSDEFERERKGALGMISVSTVRLREVLDVLYAAATKQGSAHE